MKIFPVSVDQLGELFELYDEYDRPEEQHPTADRASSILADIRAQRGEIFVAGDKAILGTYMIHICNNLTRSGQPFGVIENVICRATNRRAGVGKALMQHAIQYAKNAGCYKVMLQTGEHRLENHAFYKACGFEGGKRAFQIRFTA